MTIILVLSLSAEANNGQSTLNIFSPNNRQVDFTLLEGSRVTEKKYFNSVLFFDAAYQSLSLYNNPDFDATDLMMFMHLGIAYGVNDRLEIGGRFPFLLNQTLEDAQLGSSLELTGTGFTNITAYAKYNFIKKENFGASLLLQAGTANSESNFYIGEGSGPNLSLTFALDKRFGKWLTGFNIGYLSRSPGDRGVTYSFFEPVDSTIQASLGLSRFLSEKARLSLELLINQHDYEIDASNRDEMAMEAFLNYRRSLKRFKFIAGLGLGLNEGLSEPAYRGFVGLNYKFKFKRSIRKPEDEVEVEPISQIEEEEPIVEEPEEEVVAPKPIEETLDLEAESIAPKVIEQTITIDEEDEVSAKLEEFDKENQAAKAEFQKIILNYVEFEFNSYTLNAKSKKTLDGVAKYLESSDFKSLEVIGHTDFYGSTMYNEVLSLRRAKSVRDYIASQGIEKSKMKFNGYGKRRPVDTGVTKKARQNNRRVEIILRNNSGE